MPPVPNSWETPYPTVPVLRNHPEPLDRRPFWISRCDFRDDYVLLLLLLRAWETETPVRVCYGSPGARSAPIFLKCILSLFFKVPREARRKMVSARSAAFFRSQCHVAQKLSKQTFSDISRKKHRFQYPTPKEPPIQYTPREKNRRFSQREHD